VQLQEHAWNAGDGKKVAWEPDCREVRMGDFLCHELGW
jgi:hypothetical protein